VHVNPLAHLCKLLNVDASYIAHVSGVNPVRAAAITGCTPPPDVVTFLNVLKILHGRIRLDCAQPISFWVATSAIDALATCDEWRESMGLLRLPRHVDELKQLVAGLREGGMNGEAIADYLQAQWVTTWSGADRAVRRRDFILVNPITQKPRSERRLSWRQYVLSQMLSRAFQRDAGWSVRYGIESEIGDDYVNVRTTRQMPECVAEWVRSGLDRLAWFTGDQWGYGSDPERQLAIATLTPPP